MRIVLVRPGMTEGIAHDAMEPLAFSILAGLTPPSDEVLFFDERIEAVPFRMPADLVAISCDTFSARRAYQICAFYRRRGVPVVLGGYHPTLCTAEALDHADSVVIGDAEDTWPGLLEDLRAGRLRSCYTSQFPPLRDICFDRSIFRGKRYGPLRLVQFGRGCNHHCDFCSIRAFYGRSIRYREVGEVVSEITHLKSRGIIFADDNLFANRTKAAELLRALIPLRIRWACQAGVDAAWDDELLELMEKSGCVSVTLGLESLRSDNLYHMGKSWNIGAGDYETAIARFHARGILVYGSFVFGYDHDSLDDFAKTLEFVTRSRLFLANFNPLIPLPGTPLYARLRDEGRLIRDPWWLDAEYRYGDAVFEPVGMSAGELRDACYRLRTLFNRWGSIAGRGLNSVHWRSPFNIGMFLLGNVINRREIHRKQGLPLGRSGEIDSAFVLEL